MYATDISTAFLHGTTKDKCFVRTGIEFDKDQGKRMIIDRGLYGLASSSARFLLGILDNLSSQPWIISALRSISTIYRGIFRQRQNLNSWGSSVIMFLQTGGFSSL